MKKDRLLESVLFIINYDYKAVFERVPLLKTAPVFPQHGPAILSINVTPNGGVAPFHWGPSLLNWNERAPIYRINRYYYDHLRRENVFDQLGHLNLNEDEIDEIDKIEAWIEMDTEPFAKYKLFTCSDLGIIESLSEEVG